MGMGQSGGGFETLATTPTGPATGQHTAGAGGGMQGLDFMGMLNGLFNDPESAKAISDTFGKFAVSMSSAKKIPPHAQAFIKRSIDENLAQRAGARMDDPYLGDITRFLTPEIASSVLGDLGIPTRRSVF